MVSAFWGQNIVFRQACWDLMFCMGIRTNFRVYFYHLWCDWLRGMWLCQLNKERFFSPTIFLGDEMLEIMSLEKYRFSPFFYTEKLSKTISH
jgi:hypothetical protein